MVHITEQKHYYPLTGVQSPLILCKLSWKRKGRKKKEEEDE
jgi:hypothetical protein